MLLAVAAHIRRTLSFRCKSWWELTGAPLLKNNLVYKMEEKEREGEMVGGEEETMGSCLCCLPLKERGCSTDIQHFKKSRVIFFSLLRGVRP